MHAALSLIAIWLLINALFFVVMTPVGKSARNARREAERTHSMFGGKH
ncbi:hypothetical protein HAP48_0005055 [Bradyrhizobium septentrionale]|uniref:Uncharacterized protein n=1 Tax=Bradyrhizobium septentrionale TaxID=1404411 RepID=A0A974A4F5_9BRAD|nr:MULTISPECIES: hypothetical protein [Bradyrhizobium]UGY16880.1 hypothetical protein HAP48_0005055 [Bradyrhizobium septentrionale]UGY25645.1 hypothetical protein HU675_0001875 [Bradyrhizobium septentrionale]